MHPLSISIVVTLSWFNIVGRGTGDLREAKPAIETVNALMSNFPK